MGVLKKIAAAVSAAVLCVMPAALPDTECVLAAEEIVFSGVTGLPFEHGDPFKGVDISSVISLENSGVVFRDRDGNPQDIFHTLADAGINTVRVRIWNEPYHSQTHETYGGGICDPDCAVKIAKRCADAGLSLLADFHYSDFWADPGKQKAPKAWQNYSVSQKADAIYSFTLSTLKKIAETGVNIAMVQVGNETTTGMCGVMLESYQWSDVGWRDLCTLFSAGTKAVRDFSSKTLAAIHFTNPEKSSNMLYLAKSLDQNRVDYDVFATSYYPYWHGTMSNLTNVLTNIANTYHKKVVVAETSWVRTLDDGDRFGNTISSRDKMGSYVSYEISTAGQTAFLRDLCRAVAAVPNGNGIGVFYWEPAWLPVGNDYNSNLQLWTQYGSGWATKAAGEYDDSAKSYFGGSAVDNESLFSADGKPLDSLYFFRTVHGDGSSDAPEQANNLLLNPGFEADHGWTAAPQGWKLHGTADDHFDVRAEDTRSGGYALHWYTEQPFTGSSASASATAAEDGVYRASVYIQGDEKTAYQVSLTAGDRSETVRGTGQGWAVWEQPALELALHKGETVTLIVTVSGEAGSYGSVDDCMLVRTGDLIAPQVRGDADGDGICGFKDVSLLCNHLLCIRYLTAEQAAAVDLNSDGVLNAVDLALMKRLILAS